MDADLVAQREVYLESLADQFPWVSTDRLRNAADYLANRMKTDLVEESTAFNQETMEFAEKSGRQLAEMLGKAPELSDPPSLGTW
jgi:hypothetical protein